MALRLRRDVQKASYYVWFLGAEEAKGLRGARVINSVLPYLIDRSRAQEPLKVTLQVSHKGIKIVQGSSKHFIPHSAITSSVQTDDIVACVLLLYNPATKCPLHVHAYRCDSESTAEALHQQLQVLINRPENQKRFEELENRLGIMPPQASMSAAGGNKSSTTTAHHMNNNSSNDHSQKHHYNKQQQQQRRHETSPKRFSSSLGSDTGNSTRESECSEEHSGGSPISRSPPIIKSLPQQNNELFDSLAAELRAKLNGNGPPILLPPRDYDTVHRSKGNLTAIELRRCRNKLIVGTTSPDSPTAATPTAAGNKQVSSRGSSGIGSDLAPSPERQDLNSSSEDEHWTNEADNSVIALKPSQIAMERSGPIIPHHPLLNRKNAIQKPEDSYLRDLPAKPYMPRQSNTKNSRDKVVSANELRSSKTTSGVWSKEDEIKPIIMRPTDYDAKFNRILQSEQKPTDYHRPARSGEMNGSGGGGGRMEQTKLNDTDKYNEINRLLNKKLSLERDSPEHRYNKHNNKVKDDINDDYDDSDPSSEHNQHHGPQSLNYRKENLTDKQKFLEYTSNKQTKPSYAAEEAQRYGDGGRHRYVDPADLPFEQQPTPILPPATTNHNKFAAVHRGTTHSPEPPLVGGGHRTVERHRERQRDVEIPNDAPKHRSKERDRDRYSRSNERNPYREPESIPYIQSMEKMMKSTAMRYKSLDGAIDPTIMVAPKVDAHTKVSQRNSKTYAKQSDEELPIPRDYNYSRNSHGRSIEYTASANSNVTPKDRFKDAKDKFRAMERTGGSRHDLTDDKDERDYVRRHRTSEPEWSDEDRLDDSPPPPKAASSQHPQVSRSSRVRSRDDRWEHENGMPPTSLRSERDRDMVHAREPQRSSRDLHRDRDYGREVPPRQREQSTSKRDIRERDPRDYGDDGHRYDASRTRERSRDHLQRSDRHRDQSREYIRGENAPPRRGYSPDTRSGEHHRSNYHPSSATGGGGRSMERQRSSYHNNTAVHPDVYPPAPVTTPPPSSNGAPISHSKGGIANLTKGYRHSYAEPVFTRTGGRVGLAAVNPY